MLTREIFLVKENFDGFQIAKNVQLECLGKFFSITANRQQFAPLEVDEYTTVGYF